MATEIVMPRLSDTMDTGTVAKWLKQEGDTVKRGEIIAEIETDKANMELESYASGILARIVVGEGQSASLGQPIAIVAKDESEAKGLQSGNGGQSAGADSGAPSRSGSDAQAQTPQSQAAVRSGEAPTTGNESPNGSGVPSGQGDGHSPQGGAVAQTGGRIKASPLARRLAREHNLDIGTISGTGPGGRITKDDVQAFLKSAPQQAPAQREEQPAAQEAAGQPEPAVAGGRAGRPVEMTRMQNTIARRMAEARFSAPDFVLTSEIDMTEARALLKSIAAVEGAPKVGPNDLIIRAAAVSLSQHPDVNAGWEGNTIVQYGRVNVGFAVTVPGGLVVPVVRDADKKSLGQIASETKPLIEKARSGKLAPSDYEDGTFTVSNLGMYGIDQFTPIINVPEACILGIGAIVAKPVVVDGEIVVRDRMRVNLACDHRVANGAQAAEFLQKLRHLLEHPMLAVL